MDLASLRIAEPCPEDWATMTGDERARFCERCQLHVVNLVELRRAEAEARLSRRDPGQRLCLRVTRDQAGNVATRTTQEERFLAALQAIAAWRQAEGEP
jgi:hypothetical protein